MHVIPVVVGEAPTERGRVQQQGSREAGKRGASWASASECGRLIARASSHRIPIESHHISSLTHAKEQVALSLLSPACPYLYPSAILGHAPPPALPCLAPACLNFPYLAQLHRHNSHNLSPDLRHGASQALKATTPRCSDSRSTTHKRFALPSGLAVPRPNRIFPRDLEQGCSTLHSWPSGKPFAPL